MFFFSCCFGHRDLHSFPTRRSSDLESMGADIPASCREGRCGTCLTGVLSGEVTHLVPPSFPVKHVPHRPSRSEEQTSELQSPVHLVCRLLLEKKKIYVIHWIYVAAM